MLSKQKQLCKDFVSQSVKLAKIMNQINNYLIKETWVSIKKYFFIQKMMKC